MKEIVSEKEKSLTEKSIIKTVILKALVDGSSISLWKTPGKNEKHLIVCNEPAKTEEYQLENSQPGFAFAPFDKEATKYFFPAENYWQFTDGELSGGNYSFQQGNHEEVVITYGNPVNFHYRNTQPHNKNNFKQLVAQIVEALDEGKAEKIVASRFKDLSTSPSFQLLDLFDALCLKHPNTLVSLVSSPQTGTWLGASPENLVTVTSNNIFKTIALAGTLPYQEGIDLKAVAWTQKEIEEQALVCRYIINCFKKIRLREYEEHGPKTYIAGKLMHLKTDYEVNMSETNFPQLGSVMLKLLHPTSAVCGMPYEVAYDFLKHNEGYNREYYSGFLGPVQIKNETALYVNLRCLQAFEHSVRLYAGAGITVGSNPDKEFDETEIKFQNLQQLISA